jgi:hypothetical protein
MKTITLKLSNAELTQLEHVRRRLLEPTTSAAIRACIRLAAPFTPPALANKIIADDRRRQSRRLSLLDSPPQKHLTPVSRR